MSPETSSSERRYKCIGKYQVLSLIGTGGAGAVYRARDTEERRMVALKVLSHEATERPNFAERFRREAMHASRLRHENIAALYEWGEAQGAYYLALELVYGSDLERHVRKEGPLAPEEAREVVWQACRALAHLHSQGLVHRDIKPANFLLARKGTQPLIKLVDLGLSRETSGEEFRVTRCGATVGTLDYMAPEQTRDSASADARSDLYSLGCTWYFLLTGQPPFPEGSLGERLYQILQVAAPDVRTLNPAVDERDAALIKCLLAKGPQDRYQSAEELLRQLEGATPPAQPRSARPIAEATPPPRRRSRPVPPPTPPSSSDDTALSATPSDAEAAPAPAGPAAGQFERAKQVLATGNWEYAYQLLLSCCRLEPENVTYRQALRKAQKARRIGQQGGWLSGLGKLKALARLKLARKTGDHKGALERVEDVLLCDPSHIGARLDLSASAEALGMMDLAIWALEEACETAPRDLNVRRARARLYEKQRDFAKAVALWEEIARDDPNDSEASTRARGLATAAALARARKGIKAGGRL